jgi:hypothetical protein
MAIYHFPSGPAKHRDRESKLANRCAHTVNSGIVPLAHHGRAVSILTFSRVAGTRTRQLFAFGHDPEEQAPAAEIVVVVSVAFDDEFSHGFPVTNLECVGDDASARLQGF